MAIDTRLDSLIADLHLNTFQRYVDVKKEAFPDWSEVTANPMSEKLVGEQITKIRFPLALFTPQALFIAVEWSSG
ncbi:hypothetical protein L596_030137 [Steinernema carpocapsae]|uniref:Uncharacterized protein n=1 Tax=Steinernema carpocapsae TaxID=34508 RepID=A0A4U5LRU5_STECR|nr:hypothetical protein L596_030137 [Steinernema carpocapsae]